MSMVQIMSRAARLAAASLLGIGLLHGAAGAAELTKLRVSTIPIADTASFEVAREKGFFAAEGLEIDTTPTSGGAVGIPALMSGQLQIAYSNVVSIILAASQGLDLVVIAAADETSDAPPDLAGLVAKPGAGFKDGKALEGKRVAVNSRNNIIWLYAREWIGVTGGDPNKVTYVEVPFPQMMDAVQQGRVDAAMLVEPFLSGGLKGGQLELHRLALQHRAEAPARLAIRDHPGLCGGQSRDPGAVQAGDGEGDRLDERQHPERRVPGGPVGLHQGTGRPDQGRHDAGLREDG
jgi:NitT/TauT family transport system substrate-binding protein